MYYSKKDLKELQNYFDLNYDSFKKINEDYLEKMYPIAKNGILVYEIYDINKKLQSIEKKYKFFSEVTKKNTERYEYTIDKLSKEACEIILPFDFNPLDTGYNFDNYMENDEVTDKKDSKITKINYEQIDIISNKIDKKSEELDEKIKELVRLVNENDLDYDYVQRTNTYFNNMNQIVTSLKAFSRFLKHIKEEYEKLNESWITELGSEIDEKK